MKIDLERELGLGERAGVRGQRERWWLLTISVVCVVNLVLGIALVVRGRPVREIVKEAAGGGGLEAVVESQVVARLGLRFEALEVALRELQREVGQVRKSVLALQAERKVVARRERGTERREREARRATEAQAVVRPALSAPVAGTVVLSEAELEAFDRLIDRDDTGLEVRAFLRGLTNAAQANAYLAQLQDKGDRWLNAAMTAADEMDPLFGEYYTNALYFYDIVRDVAADKALVAYAETKRSQLQVAQQRHELRRMTAEREERTQESLERVEERLRRVDSDVRRVKDWLELR